MLMREVIWPELLAWSTGYKNVGNPRLVFSRGLGNQSMEKENYEERS